MTAPAVRAVEHRLTAYKRLWRASLLTSFAQPILFLLGMGLGVGSLVNRNEASTDALGGTPYAAFIAPGLLIAACMVTASIESTWEVMAFIKLNRGYHAMLASPLTTDDLVTSHALWLAFRTAINASVFAVVLMFFDDTRTLGLLAAVPGGVLTGLAFGMPIAAFAATRETDAAFAGLQRFVITPMFLFGGVFYPISQLPDALEPVAWVTPLWHGTEILRGALLGDLGVVAAAGHVAYLAAFALVGASVARVLFARRLTP